MAKRTSNLRRKELILYFRAPIRICQEIADIPLVAKEFYMLIGLSHNGFSKRGKMRLNVTKWIRRERVQ